MHDVDEDRGPLASIALPRSPIYYCLHAVALAVGLDYWLDSLRFESGLPFSLRILLRPDGDGEYIALIGGLARGISGEFSTADHFRSGVLAFPFGSVMLHASCAAFLGRAGFVVADALASLSYYVVLAAFLRTLGLSDLGSRTAAILTATGVTVRAWGWFCAHAPVPPGLELVFWGQRLPRPLVAEPLTLLALTSLAVLVLKPPAADRRPFWLALGFSLAFLVESDPYAAAAVLPIAVVAVPFAALRAGRDTRTRSHLPWFFGALAVGLAPSVYQHVEADPDVTRRLGVFAVPRLHPPSRLWEWHERLTLVLGSLCVVGIIGFLRGGLSTTRRLAVIFFLGAVTLGAWVAMPVSGLVLGRVAQLYHFRSEWTLFTSYVLLAASCLALESSFDWVRARLPRADTFRTLVPPGLALAAGGVSACAVIDSGHLISMENPRITMSSRYRLDLADLVRALESRDYANRRILGTFDPVLYEWWVGLQGRFGYVSDPFLSTRPDAEHEARFMAFCHEVGIGEEEFRRLVWNSGYQIFWISHDKYDVSPLHAFGGKADYGRPAQNDMIRGDFMKGWNIVVPNSEARRLGDDYAKGAWRAQHFAPLDIVVLTTREVAVGWSPAQDRFRETFSNPTFKVWVKR